MIIINCIGVGHWGPNLVRAFATNPEARVGTVCDLSEERLALVRRNIPQVSSCSKDPLATAIDPDADAVVIATPVSTHYALAKAALEAGKHVLVEKPLCRSVAEGEELVELARRQGKQLSVGHVFLFNNGVRAVRNLIRSGELGRIHYIYSTRTNLGPIRADVSVIEDLATHEITIFDFLFGRAPNWVSAAGSCLLGTSRQDVAFVTLEYGDGTLAQIHVSWLHPQKIRTLTVVGTKRMVVWDDMEAAEPVRVYDKGVVEEPYYDSFGEFKLRLRDADIVIPKIHLQEPLRVQAEAFIRRLTTGEATPCEAEAGVRVVACLEAIRRSLGQDGNRVPVDAEASARPGTPAHTDATSQEIREPIGVRA